MRYKGTRNIFESQVLRVRKKEIERIDYKKDIFLKIKVELP